MNGYRRDLRKYARQTNVRLFIGFLILLITVGEGLIFVFYGTAGALSGFVCLMAGLFPLLLIWIALLGIDWIVQKANDE